MTPEEFETARIAEDYGPAKEVHFAPNTRSEVHRHDQISFVYVVSGQFILNTDDGTPAYGPGDTCLLAADTPHAEEAGPDGATILVARK